MTLYDPQPDRDLSPIFDRWLASIKTKAPTAPKRQANPATTLAMNAAIREAYGYPWTNIPRIFRRWGMPDRRVFDLAVECLGRASTRLSVLTLNGPVGVGKTTAACLLATWIATDRHPDINVRPSEHAVGFLPCMQAGWLTEDQIHEAIAYPILAMDDLSGNLSLAGLEKVQRIVDARISNRRATIITTTMSIADIYDRETTVNSGRELGLSSRLGGGCIVTLSGEDRRLAVADDAKSRAMSDP